MNDQLTKTKLLQQIPLRRFVKYIDWKSLDSSLNQTYYMHVVLQDDSVLKIQEHSSESLIRKVNLDLEQYAEKQGWIEKVSPYCSFSKALELLKQGQKICRKDWNGKGMWLSYLDPYHNNQFSITEKDGAEGTFSPYIGMKTADNKYVPWLASQTDLLADDWMIAE